VREILPPGARRRWLARRVGRHATAIVAVSEAVAAWLREEGLALRLHVIPNGIALRPDAEPRAGAERLGLPADGIRIGLHGQLVPHTGAL
jgi:hypothetical protein